MSSSLYTHLYTTWTCCSVKTSTSNSFSQESTVTCIFDHIWTISAQRTELRLHANAATLAMWRALGRQVAQKAWSSCRPTWPTQMRRVETIAVDSAKASVSGFLRYGFWSQEKHDPEDAEVQEVKMPGTEKPAMEALNTRRQFRAWKRRRRRDGGKDRKFRLKYGWERLGF